MKSIDLLTMAEKQASIGEWQRRLGLSDATLYTAKNRGVLSPSIAGALAEAMGEDVEQWMILAALEGERPSACKERMLERYALALH